MMKAGKLTLDLDDPKQGMKTAKIISTKISPKICFRNLIKQDRKLHERIERALSDDLTPQEILSLDKELHQEMSDQKSKFFTEFSHFLMAMQF